MDDRAELFRRTSLLQFHCECCAASAAASHRNALRINRLGELTAEFSTALVRKRADQLVTGRDERLQGRCRNRSVASTLSLRLPAAYSALVITTESGAGVACGVTVKPTLRATAPVVPCKVATVDDAT